MIALKTMLLLIVLAILGCAWLVVDLFDRKKR